MTVACGGALLWLALLLAGDSHPSEGQEAAPGPPPGGMRSQAQRLFDLQVRRARWRVERQELEMESRKSDYEAMRDLFDQKIETLDRLHRALGDYRRARLAYEEAQLQLERTRLSFLTDATHVDILEAKKYRTPDGRRHVDIVISNDSNSAQAASLNPDKSDGEIRALLEIQSIEISLQEQASGLIVAEPYEISVPSLKLGETKRLTFRLLEDHDEVLVAMMIAGDRDQDRHIVLRREAFQDMPSLSSAQFSQEADLNSRVRFDLVVERLAEEERAYHLAVVHLPAAIEASFLDRETGAELSQIKLDGKTTRREIDLELRIPAKLDPRYIDKVLIFHALVTDREGLESITGLVEEHGLASIPPTAIDLETGSVQRLELTPRGQGALEIIVGERYQEVGAGETVTVRVGLHNSGTLQVHRVRVDVAVPLHWDYAMTPESIAVLMPGEREPLDIILTPPSAAGVSEYDIRLFARARNQHDEMIEATEEDITIRIEPRAAVLRSALIIAVMLCLVVALVVVTIKTSRR